jgi:hypothetical protein
LLCKKKLIHELSHGKKDCAKIANRKISKVTACRGNSGNNRGMRKNNIEDFKAGTSISAFERVGGKDEYPGM